MAQEGQIIYQVEATLNKDVPIGDYLNWLHVHAEEILNTAKGFISAEAALAESDQLDGPNTLIINYRVDSRENLQHYFENHGARLREAGVAKWGDQVTYQRKILQVKESLKAKPQTSVFGYVH